MILEILISTMNRNNLSFLDGMFDNNTYSHLQILIVNQTSPDKTIESNKAHIRVINSFEYGLSKSRNLAIKNAIGDICLIADDDVKYLKGFDKHIKQAFLRDSKASIINFKIDTFCGRDYKKYPEKSKRLRKRKDIASISSVEMAFRRKDVVKNNILFNTFFGLGSHFPSGEEYLFLSDALKKTININFVNTAIVKHLFQRSTSNLASDNYIKTQAAIYYIDYGVICYLFLLKLIFFLLRKKLIQLKDAKGKFKAGLKGIKEYKKLIKESY